MLLTGKTAFQSTDDIMQKVERNEFPHPREINSQIPMPLEAVCLKAMARTRDDRYSTPLELAEELERWLADAPVRAWREPITVRMRRRIARHRTAFAMATTTAVLLIAVLVNYSIQRWHRLAVLRQQVDIHVGQGIAAAHAENLDQAIANLAEAAGLCRQEQSLSTWHEKSLATWSSYSSIASFANVLARVYKKAFTLFVRPANRIR